MDMNRRRMMSPIALAAMAAIGAQSTQRRAPHEAKRQLAANESTNDTFGDACTAEEAHSEERCPGQEYGRGQIVRRRGNVGRNDPCPCNSGKKFKKCCLAKMQGTYEHKRDPAKLPKPRGERSNLVIVDEEVLVQEAAASTTAPASKNATAMAMLNANVSKRIVWAYLETGLYITDINRGAHLAENLAKWDAALDAYDKASPEEQLIMLAPARPEDA